MPRITVNIDQVVQGVEKEKELSKKALQRTIGDMRTRGPGWVNKAVREEYNIKAGDLKSAMHTEKGGTLNFGGVLVDNVALVYKGRGLTPVHFKMSPTSRPKGKKSYQITAEIKKGNREVLHGKPEYSGKPFIASNGHGQNIAFQRRGTAGKKGATERTNLYGITSISIPQMVEDGNGNLKPRVEQTINENLEKRFRHYTEQYLGK